MVGLGGRGSNTRGHLKTLRAAINSDLHTSIHTGHGARLRASQRSYLYGWLAARLDGADVEWTVGSHSSSVDRLPSPSHRPKAIASVVTAK